MNFKRLLFISCLITVLFFTIAAVSADGSYTIVKSEVDLNVLSSGMLHVDEKYVYNFDGTFNGVYRDIPLKEGESIENINVSARGAYPVLHQTMEDGKQHLKIYLYADEAHTKKINDCRVTVYISYDMKNVVTVFRDVAALQYKLRGEEWDVGTDILHSHMELPNASGNEYYLNPEALTRFNNTDGNEIDVTTNSIPKGDYYEVLVLMPVDDFSSSPHAKHVNRDGRDMIIKNLEDSRNSDYFWNSIVSFFEVFALGFPPLALIGTYFKYGREPEVSYDGIYERELPTDDPPAVVNAMIDNNRFAEPNMNGFEATILDLIDRNVLSIEKDNDDLLLSVNNENSLDNAEKIVVNILSRFAEDGVLNLSKLNSKMKTKSNAEWFLNQFNKWKEAVGDEYFTDDVKKEYFDDTGTVIAKRIGLLGIVLAVVFVLVYLFTEFSRGFELFVIGIVVGLFSLYILSVRDDIFGKWTYEGRVIYLKWKNFKKFLKDNSLINEHPPQSIVIWKKYLIYGTSLGVAKSVEKSMNLHVPNVNEYHDGVFLYHYYGYNTFYYSFHSAHSTTTSDNISGFGSAGGGSGGGGGGAF